MSAEILLATSNPNKLREVRQVFEPLGYTILSLADLSESEELP